MTRFRLTSDKIQLSEKDVVRACLDVLQWRHYWPIRQHVGRFLHADRAVIQACREARVPLRFATIGEPGDPDWAVMHARRPGFFMEMKRPGGKPEEGQQKRHAELALCGFETPLIDSKEALDDFLKQYEKAFPVEE